MNPLVLGLLAATLTSSALLASPLSPPDPSAITSGRLTPHVQDLAPAASSAGVWPVQPAHVERGFERSEQYGPGHRGADLVAWPGQIVRSAITGSVKFVGRVAGHPLVVVSHEEGLSTTYLPVDPLVHVGEEVAAGERIGLVATDLHCATGPCLHWGARQDHIYIDPLTLLARRVVLLPH